MRILAVTILSLVLSQPLPAGLEEISFDQPIWDLLTGTFKKDEAEQVQELDAVFRALQAGNKKIAERLVTELLEKEPEHALALEVLGTIRLEQQRLQEAEILLQRSLDAEAGRASAMGKLGAAKLGLGRTGEGEAQLREALALEPDQIFVLNTLARLEAARRRFGPAIELYRRLLQTRYILPLVFSVYHIELCRALLASGDEAGVLALVEPALAKLKPGPLRRQALRLATIAQVRTGNIDAAKPLAEALLASSKPFNVTATLTKAMVLQAAGDSDAVLKLLREASVVNDHAALHQALGQTYGQQKDFAAAARSFEAAIAAAPSVEQAIRLVREYGSVAFAGGELAGAVKIATQTAKRYPDNAELGVIAATMRASAGEPARALKDLGELQRKFPEEGDIYVQRAQLLLQRGREKEAKSSLEEAVKLIPQRSDAWMLLSELQTSPKAARGVLRRGLQHNPGDPDLRYDLTFLDELRMSPVEAIDAYQAIRRDSPAHTATLIRLAGLLTPNPNARADAKSMLTQARALGGDTLDAVSTDAWLHHHTGRSGDALRRLKAIVKQFKHPITRYRIAAIHAVAGRRKEARKSARAALKAGLAGVERADAERLAK